MTEKRKVAAVILGAGKGKRMGADIPKVMMPVCGKPMIRHIIETLETVPVDRIITVISPEGQMVKDEVSPYETMVQKEALGTGSAALAAKEALKGFDGIVLVAYGDNPTLGKEIFTAAIDKINSGFATVNLGVRVKEENRYGRLKMDGDRLLRIVEFKDATDEEKQIELCNSDLMAFDGKYMFDILDAIGNNNAAGEYYLTDAVEIANNMGLKCGIIEVSDRNIAGANTRSDLALLEEFLQKRNKCAG